MRQTVKRDSSAVSPVIASIILTSIVVALGFGVWALTASMATNWGRQFSSDLDDRIANVRSSLVIEYLAKVSNGLYLCLYNNLETPLTVVDALFLRQDKSPINALNPREIVGLPPKSRSVICTTVPIPAGASGRIIVQVWAMPAHLFDPNDPFARLDKAVKAEKEVVL